MAEVFGESIFNGKVTAFSGIEATDISVSGSSQLLQLDVFGNVNTTGITTASKFVVTSGNSSQFLKADGSLDPTTYLTLGTLGGTPDNVGGQVVTRSGTGGFSAGIVTTTSLTVNGSTTTTSLNVNGNSTITGILTVGNVSITPDTNRFTVNNSGFYINSSTGQLELTTAGFNLAFDGINIIPRNKTKLSYIYTGADQSWVVPAGITYIYVKLWGSGGGGGHYGGWSFGSWGGGGGHTRGIVPVTAGETLTIRVPRGGYAVPGTTNAPYGGGTATSAGDNQYAGGGGGYCGLFRSSIPLLIAGAGGGGGSVTGSHAMCNGGAGGGYNGLRGESRDGATAFAGGGGTQSAGGAAGNGGNTGGGAGSSLQGGSVQGNNYGGGGGGGYFGGGSGSYGSSNTMAGGGGGSGFTTTTALLAATFSGKGAYPAGIDDIDYPASTASNYSSTGFGGVQRNNGGDGFLVIYY